MIYYSFTNGTWNDFRGAILELDPKSSFRDDHGFPRYRVTKKFFVHKLDISDSIFVNKKIYFILWKKHINILLKKFLNRK
jgi:hypothetical protein